MIRLHCVFLSALILGVLVWARGADQEDASRLPHIIQIDFFEAIDTRCIVIKHGDQCYTLCRGQTMSVATNQSMQDEGKLFILKGNILYCLTYPSYQNIVASHPGLMSCTIEIGYLEDYIAGSKSLPKGYTVRRMFYRDITEQEPTCMVSV